MNSQKKKKNMKKSNKVHFKSMNLNSSKKFNCNRLAYLVTFNLLSYITILLNKVDKVVPRNHVIQKDRNNYYRKDSKVPNTMFKKYLKRKEER